MHNLQIPAQDTTVDLVLMFLALSCTDFPAIDPKELLYLYKIKALLYADHGENGQIDGMESEKK